MNATEPLARRLPDLLTEHAAARVPDYFTDILVQTARTPQRPARTILERTLGMDVDVRRPVVAPPIPWRAFGLALLLILALAAGLLLVAGSRPPLPAPFGPAHNGLIVYAADGDIYTVDPVSSVARAIVTGPDVDVDPVFSRDGTLVAFARETTAGMHVYVARGDGSGLTRVTPEPLPIAHPGESEYTRPYAFSPDGTTLLVAARCGGTWIAKADGSEVRAITGVTTSGWFDFRPPDGKQFAFVTCGNDAVAIVNTDGTGLVELAGSGWPIRFGTPRWAPDGSLLAYDTWDQGVKNWTVRTRIVDADGNGDRPLRTTPAGDFDGVGAWSNDGRRMVIVRGEGNAKYAVVLPVDGEDPGIRSSEPLVTSLVCCEAFEWAPDDTSVLVTPVDHSGLPAQQLLLDPATGELTPASWATTSQPSWQRRAP